MKQERYLSKNRRVPLWARLILAAVLIGIVTFSCLLGAVIHGDCDYIVDRPQVMIVLGCKVEPWGPSVLLRDRLGCALDFWKDHQEIKVVVSGGKGSDEPVPEANAMAEYLINNGIPQEKILLEDRSHNTLQNFKYTGELLEAQGISRDEEILVVSNGFHLTRARMLAQRMGFENVSTLAASASHRPSRIKMYFREPLALLKSIIFDR